METGLPEEACCPAAAAACMFFLGFKTIPRPIDQDIKHPTNPSLTESTAAQHCPTDLEARAVPCHSPNNFPKPQPITFWTLI